MLVYGQCLFQLSQKVLNILNAIFVSFPWSASWGRPAAILAESLPPWGPATEPASPLLMGWLSGQGICSHFSSNSWRPLLPTPRRLYTIPSAGLGLCKRLEENSFASGCLCFFCLPCPWGFPAASRGRSKEITKSSTYINAFFFSIIQSLNGAPALGRGGDKQTFSAELRRQQECMEVWDCGALSFWKPLLLDSRGKNHWARTVEKVRAGFHFRA